MAQRLRIGLVGAGPWASTVHGPGIAAHPATELAGVWARRPDAAAALAAAHRAKPFTDVTELIAASDAVAFAVPPAVQAELATAAAKAGRHLILEKPIASTLDEAQRLADAVDAAGVTSIVVLTLRFAPETRAWLADVTARGGWRGGTARWLSGVLLGGKFSASPWRHSDGALADIGPHVVDLLDAALGEVTDVHAAHHGEPDLWHLVLGHAGGATSAASISLKLPLIPTITSVDVYGDHGHSEFGGRSTPALASFAMLLDELVETVQAGHGAKLRHSAKPGRTGHPLDVRRGLHLQRVLHRARLLSRGGQA
jgi:predicted dehydrogenase